MQRRYGATQGTGHYRSRERSNISTKNKPNPGASEQGVLAVENSVEPETPASIATQPCSGAEIRQPEVLRRRVRSRQPAQRPAQPVHLELGGAVFLSARNQPEVQTARQQARGRSANESVRERETLPELR